MNQIEAGASGKPHVPLFFFPRPLDRTMRGGGGKRGCGWLYCLYLIHIHPRGKLVGVLASYTGISGRFLKFLYKNASCCGIEEGEQPPGPHTR